MPWELFLILEVLKLVLLVTIYGYAKYQYCYRRLEDRRKIS